MSKIPSISISELLDAGAHFGHKAARWNPKMAPYIYGIRDNIHILDLQHTVGMMQVAMKRIYETVKNNGHVLFVGTKVQASEIIAEYAKKCGQYYVNHRWLGGTLTNWHTVSQSIKTLEAMEKTLEAENAREIYTKKELLEISRKTDKLLRAFAGIRSMNGKPDLIVIIDTNKEHLAIAGAKTLGIPIIAITDTNSDPDDITFPVPGNDDAIRSIRVYVDFFSRAALAGNEASLAASGVDLGSVAEGVAERLKSSASITKLKEAPKKISKVAAIVDEEAAAKFAEGLANEAKGKTKFAEGLANEAKGRTKFAEGLANEAKGKTKNVVAPAA